MNLYQTIYDKIVPSLPEDWVWLTLRFTYGDNRTKSSIVYWRTLDRRKRESLRFDEPRDGSPDLHSVMLLLRDEIAPKPLEQFTHIELTFEREGKFESVLGYGEPNWDLMASWPDDITAQDYTYVNSFPNGVNKATSLAMNDPRTLIGVKIRDE